MWRATRVWSTFMFPWNCALLRFVWGFLKEIWGNDAPHPQLSICICLWKTPRNTAKEIPWNFLCKMHSWCEPLNSHLSIFLESQNDFSKCFVGLFSPFLYFSGYVWSDLTEDWLSFQSWLLMRMLRLTRLKQKRAWQCRTSTCFSSQTSVHPPLLEVHRTGEAGTAEGLKNHRASCAMPKALQEEMCVRTWTFPCKVLIQTPGLTQGHI